MYRQAHQHLQRLPRRWLVAAAFVSSITAFAWLAYCAHSDLTQSFDQLEYGCQRPPPSIWRKYLPVEHLEHENHHTFMSSPGSKILMLQHCVYPSKRMIMPLSNHQDYARRHGYAYSVRTGLVDPARNKKNSPFWEKVYLTQQVIEEQWKLPEAERLEWIVWSDADTLILNPTIAMETFLPPKDDDETWFVISRDHWGINFGVFALRPNQKAWQFLWEVLWNGDILPDFVLPMKEQSAMQLLLPRDGVVIIPKEWANGWGQENPFEMLEKEPFGGGSPTCLQAHFSGLSKIHMAGYIEHFADPRFNHSWDEGRQHWEAEAERFWSQRPAPCTATNA